MNDTPQELAGIRITRVRCFCGRVYPLSRFEQGTCPGCGAFIAVYRADRRPRLIWAYGEARRVRETPEIIAWEPVP